MVLLWRYRQRRLPIQQHLLDAIPVPLFMTDLNGLLTCANSAFAEALDIDINAHRGDAVQALMARGGLYEEGALKEGVTLWQTLLQNNALGYGYVGGWQDMREHQQILKQLRQAKHSAEKASRVKPRFSRRSAMNCVRRSARLSASLNYCCGVNSLTPAIVTHYISPMTQPNPC